MALIVHGAVAGEFLGLIPDGVGELSTKGLPPGVSSSNSSLLAPSAQFASARTMQMRAFCSQTFTPWNMSMPKFYYQWNDDAQEWSRVEDWIPKHVPGLLCLAVFDDDENMTAWSGECGKVKAVPSGTRKRTLKILDDALQDVDTKGKHQVVEVVSQDGSQCFRGNEAMAILDPLCSSQFWNELKGLDVECLFMSPGTSEALMVQACDVAEWQAARGKVLVTMVNFENGGWFDKEVAHSNRLSWCYLSDGRSLVSNHEDVLDHVAKKLQSGLEVDEAHLVAIMKNQEEKYQNTNDLTQNSKAHLFEIDHELEYKDQNYQNTDDLTQNSEAHLASNYDVCQEHGGSVLEDVCQEHGGSPPQGISEVFVSELVTQSVEWSSTKLLGQRDFSMASLEEVLM